MKNILKKIGKTAGGMLITAFVVCICFYGLDACDMHPQGLMESDLGVEKLDIFSNGTFRYVCIGKHEVVTVGVSNLTNFKCNDGTVIRNITNYVLR